MNQDVDELIHDIREMDAAWAIDRGVNTAAWSHDIGGLLRILGEMRAGDYQLYKPGVAVSYYDHDEIASVYVTRCKACPVESTDEIVIRTGSVCGVECVRRALLSAILIALRSGAR